MKKIVRYSMRLLLFVFIIEAASFIVIYFYNYIPQGEKILRTEAIYEMQTEKIYKFLNSNKILSDFDPVLGWRPSPGYLTNEHQINSYALRSNHEYSQLPSKNILRVSAFGDSFVYGGEVINEDSWPAIIESEYNYIEVLNYGVGGYATDQAYLRYQREGNEFSPQIVLIGFAPVNLRRAVNVYRRFISNQEFVLFKPRFILDNKGELNLLKNPLNEKSDYMKFIKDPKLIREVGENDQWYEPAIYENFIYDLSATNRLVTTLWLRIYNRFLDENRILDGDVFNVNSEAFKIQVKVIEQFVQAVKNDNRIPIVILLPDYDSINNARVGKQAVYAPLVAELLARNIEYEDMMDAFLDKSKTDTIDKWFAPGRHYSAEGNSIIAHWIAKKLNAMYDIM